MRRIQFYTRTYIYIYIILPGLYDQRAEREEEGEKRRVDGERRKKRQKEKRKREEKRRRNGVRKKGMEDLPPHARTGEKREWRRENKSAPSSIHGALMCHLTEIPPIRGIDLQSNAPLCACAWVWSCIMHEGEGGPASVSIREIAATSSRGKERKKDEL